MPKRRAPKQARPYCFVGYSTREPHVALLVECLKIVFTPHFDVKITPSALVSGASQRDEIAQLVANCAFAVVAIDGLRPNVVWEYGALHAHDKPVILLKEADARVDIDSYYQDAANLTAAPVKINLDTQLSDVKDVNYAIWNRFSIATTVGIIWSEYVKKKDEIAGYVDIPEPKLW